MQLAELDQTQLASLPASGASEHVHLEPNLDLAASSVALVMGRLDDKKRKFDETYRPRSVMKARTISHRW